MHCNYIFASAASSLALVTFLACSSDPVGAGCRMPVGATITSVDPPYPIGSVPVTLDPGQEIVVELDFDGDSPDNCGVFEWTYAGGAIAVSTDGGPSATITGVGFGEASVRVVDEMDRTVVTMEVRVMSTTI